MSISLSDTDLGSIVATVTPEVKDKYPLIEMLMLHSFRASEKMSLSLKNVLSYWSILDMKFYQTYKRWEEVMKGIRSSRDS